MPRFTMNTMIDIITEEEKKKWDDSDTHTLRGLQKSYTASKDYNRASYISRLLVMRRETEPPKQNIAQLIEQELRSV